MLRSRNLVRLLCCSAAFTLISCSAPPDKAEKTVPRESVLKASAATPRPELKSIEGLTEAALRSVVVITHFGRDGNENGVGAGFIISSDGLVATSLHVIGEGRPIRVRLADGRHCEVTEVHATDRKFDLAILRIAGERLPALPLGDSDALKQGAPVVALGNPIGLEHSVVQGVVSARREVEGIEMIQIAIPIEPGNSGGPLLDLKGRVQGVLTLKSAVTANLGFAMPANNLRTLLDKPNPVPMNRWLTLGALNPRQWQPLFGARWSQKAGRILVEGAGWGFGGRSLCLSQKTAPQRPYEVAVSVKLDDEAGAAGLIFEADGGDRHYGFYPSAGQLRLTRFDGPNVYSWSILRQIPTEHYRPGDWNHLRVRVEEETIRCYVNGHLVTESDDRGLANGKVGLAKFRDTEAEFKNFQTGTNLANEGNGPADSVEQTLAARLAKDNGDVDEALLDDLRRQGAPGQSALRKRAAELDLQANHLRRLAGTIHRQTVQADLVKALAGTEGETDLFQAALLVAKLDNADLDIGAYQQQLTEMSQELGATLPAEASQPARLSALLKYLFAEHGFHGSRGDYHDRANSYINQVLDDREGLPITLSILFLELGQRIGLRGLSGLPLPGHFMVAFTPVDGPDQIIDVFGGGTVLTRSEAQERIIEATGEGFQDSDYRRATKREIIVRMLRNLLGLAQRNNSASDALRYLDVIVALSPDSISDRLNRARLRLQTSDVAGAREDFKWLLDARPPGVDLERIAELYHSL